MQLWSSLQEECMNASRTNEASPQQTGKNDWPRVSIVTPSFNQAMFLEETIRSVLPQEYPNLRAANQGLTEEDQCVLNSK